MERNEDFNFKAIPGQKLKDKLSINDGKPLISIATAYYNCKDYIMQTAYSILNQTFPYWEWNIVNDGSTEEGTKEIFEKLTELDSRIHVINQENQGRLVARDNAVKAGSADLVFILDSDDCIDETYLETAYFSMITNPDATWAYADVVTFEGKNFLWKKIFDCEEEKKENILPVCALVKKQAIFDVGGYAAVDEDVHEDWHMWLRMLEKGMYPIRMNYYGFWYRSKAEGSMMASIKGDKAKQEHAMSEIRKQAKKIKDDITALQFPMSTSFDYDSYPTKFDWDRQPIVDKSKKNILFIFPWLVMGGADKFNFDLISKLDPEEYNITIVTTEPCDYVWRQKFEQYATVFDLTTFLHRKYWPSFLDYLMKSRQIDLVFQSQSYYGYYVLPWLKSQYPQVPFVDYVHAENWSWRNGEYPRDSTAIAGFVDKTYTCTKFLRTEMLEKMDRHTDNVLPVYIGVDSEEFNQDSVKIEDDEDLVRAMEKHKNQKIILFVCRISVEKRPFVALKIMKKLKELGKDYCLFIVGNGDLLDKVKNTAQREKLMDNVEFFGAKNNVKPFYKASNALLVCSLNEGLTLTTYESMSMGKPVISARIGGQAELIDESCGRLVDNIQSQKDLFSNKYYDEEITNYANAIIEVLENENYEGMCKKCREKITSGFEIKDMIKTLDNEMKSLIESGSKVGLDANNYQEIAAQYLVLFNEMHQVNFFSEIGGKNVSSGYYDGKSQRFKDVMWKNPLYRGFIGFLHKSGIMKAAKKTGIDKKIKKQIRKRMK